MCTLLSLRFPEIYSFIIFKKKAILSLLNQFSLIAFVSSNYYMCEATGYAGSYVLAGKGTRSPWYMKSIGLSEALGMLLEPQRLQASESQGREHTASGSSGLFPSLPMTGERTWEGAGCWGPNFSSWSISGGCLLLPACPEMATLSPARSLIQKARPSDISLLCLLEDSCPSDGTSHIILLHSPIRLLSAIGAKSVPVFIGIQ